jgi:hypothetical protein
MNKFWTADEDALMREFFSDMETKKVAQRLGRSESSIHNRAFFLGLHKSADYMVKERKRAAKALAAGGVVSRFGKGCTPWNKGMKGLQIGGKETQFKPGQKPVNTWKPIGSERIDKDGFLWRKVADTGIKRDDWVCAHVALWESHNGPVPAGHVVKFKDGDTTRIEIDNLECIDRAELMRRNTVHRLPKELAELCQLRGVLNRQIRLRSGDEQG